MRSLEGVVTAIVTPYDENFRIDYDVFTTLLDRQLDACIDGILIGGSTGEGLLINDTEFALLLQHARKQTEGKAAIVAACSFPATQQSVDRARIARQYGVDFLLVSAPSYVKPSIEGIFLHLEAIYEASLLPIVFYHHPGRTGVSLNQFQLQNIIDQPYIAGVKDSSGNLELYQSLLFRESQVLYCGDDGLTIPFMSIGARGSISVISNLFPLEYRAILLLCLRDQMKEAMGQWRKLHTLITPLFKEGNPAGIKSALSLCGLCLPTLRQPLTSPSKSTLDELEKELLKIANTHSFPLLS